MANQTIARLNHRLWTSQGALAAPEFTAADSAAAWIPDLLAWMLKDAEFFDIHIANTAPVDTTRIWFQTATVAPSVSGPGSMYVYSGGSWVAMTQALFVNWLKTRMNISGGPAAQTLSKNDTAKTISISGGNTIDISSWLTGSSGGKFVGGTGVNSYIIGGTVEGLTVWDNTKPHMTFKDGYPDMNTSSWIDGSTSYQAPGIHPTGSSNYVWHVLQLAL